MEATRMKTSTRCYWSLAVLLTALANRSAGAEPLSRVEIARIGKAATALVEIKGRGYGSAFCIHPSGLFITNDHVAQGDLCIILKPGSKDEKVYKARVVRSDKDLDLALLRIEGVKDLPTLSLGSDDKLAELMELVAVGFPFGTAVTRDRKGGYPAVSVNVGSVTALRRNKDDALDRIQLDAALNPGNSGGPVLDKDGKVVGVVVSGILGSGVNSAIPVSILARFVARPDIHFNPPQVSPANIHKPVVFEVQILPILKPTTPTTVELVLKGGNGKERRYPLEAAAEGKFHATIVLLPPVPGGPMVRLLAKFENSMLNATTADRTFKVGAREVKLSEVAKIQFQPTVRVVLHDGKAVEGVVSGLEAVQVRLGEQSVPLDLVKAAAVRLGTAAETDEVSYTLVVRQGDNEILRQTERLAVEDFLSSPAAMLEMFEKVGEVRLFKGHTAMGRYVTYSPNGQRALSAGFDGTIRLWNVAKGEEIRQFRGHTHPWIFQVLFSPDGRRAVSCGADGTVRVWDVETGKQEQFFAGHQGAVFGVAFAPDGRHVLSGGMDGILRLWDVKTGKEASRFVGHKDGVYCVAFSPDGKMAVSGSVGRWQGGHNWMTPTDTSVRLWDVVSGKELHCLEGHTKEIRMAAFSPDGRRVVSGSEDTSARVWDVVKGKQLCLFEKHTGSVLSVAFSPDGRSVLSGGWDPMLRLWDPATGREQYTARFENVLCAAFSPDGDHALVSCTDGIMHLLRLPDPPPPDKDMP